MVWLQDYERPGNEVTFVVWIQDYERYVTKLVIWVGMSKSHTSELKYPCQIGGSVTAEPMG